MVKLEQQVWIGPMASLERALEPYVDHSIQALADSMGSKRQQSVLVGRTLLKFALIANGLLAKDSPLPEIAYTPLRKPFFVDLPVHFNLSHSHGWIALSLGDQPQGIDIELIDLKRTLRPALLKRVLLPPELSFLLSLQSAHETERFLSQSVTSWANPAQGVSGVLGAEGIKPEGRQEVLFASPNSRAKSAESAVYDVETVDSMATVGANSTAHSALTQRGGHCAQGEQSLDSSVSALQTTQEIPASEPKTQCSSAMLGETSLPRIQEATVSTTPTKLLKSTRTEGKSLDSSFSQEAYNFFFLQWTVKECLLKLQGSSIFALGRLHIEPKDRAITIQPVEPHKTQGQDCSLAQTREQPSDLPWFKRLFSYKLSTLLNEPHSTPDFWLTIGTYGEQSPQIFVLATEHTEQVEGVECATSVVLGADRSVWGDGVSCDVSGQQCALNTKMATKKTQKMPFYKVSAQEESAIVREANRAIKAKPTENLPCFRWCKVDCWVDWVYHVES